MNEVNLLVRSQHLRTKNKKIKWKVAIKDKKPQCGREMKESHRRCDKLLAYLLSTITVGLVKDGNRKPKETGDWSIAFCKICMCKINGKLP